MIVSLVMLGKQARHPGLHFNDFAEVVVGAGAGRGVEPGLTCNLMETRVESIAAHQNSSFAGR
jgi:hypothetical protein